MSAVAPTQSIAMRLITDIMTRDEAGIIARTSKNIVFTTAHDGGQPVVKEGQFAYLESIRHLWQAMVSCRYSSFEYGQFTPTSGNLGFSHICEVKKGEEKVFMYSEGNQTFTFADGVITALRIVETDTFLTPEQCVSTIAKIIDQKSKIAKITDATGTCVIS